MIGSRCLWYRNLWTKNITVSTSDARRRRWIWWTRRASKHAFHGSTRDITQECSSYALWVTASGRTLMLCSRATTRPSATKMTPTTIQRPRHHLLQRLRRLPHLRQHRHLQTTAVRCVWSGSGMASHLSLAATRGSALLVNMGSGCPICRADIQMVMRVYNWQHWTL